MVGLYSQAILDCFLSGNSSFIEYVYMMWKRMSEARWDIGMPSAWRLRGPRSEPQLASEGREKGKDPFFSP